MSRGGIGVIPPGGVIGGGVPLVDADPVPAPLTAVVATPEAAQGPQDPLAALSAFHGAILINVQPVALPPDSFMVAAL